MSGDGNEGERPRSDEAPVEGVVEGAPGEQGEPGETVERQPKVSPWARRVSGETRALLFAALEAHDPRSNVKLAQAFGIKNESTVRYLTKEWKKEKRAKLGPQASVPVAVAHVLEVARVNGYAARLAELLMGMAEELSTARDAKKIRVNRLKMESIGEALKIILATRASVSVFAPGEGGMVQDVPMDVLEAVMRQLDPELSKKLMDALGAKVNVTVSK